MDIWQLVVGTLVYVQCGVSRLQVAPPAMLKDHLQRIAEDLGRSVMVTSRLLH